MQQRAKVVLYGAGGHAKTVLATTEAEGRYEAIGLLDDDAGKHGQTLYGYEVLGGSEQSAALRRQGVTNALVAVGDNLKRTELARFLREQGFNLMRAIHPTATLLRGCSIGEGTVVLVNAFVGADATVRDNVIVSVGVVVGHDSSVGSGAQLSPGVNLGGGARIGNHAFVGMGASVLPQVTVGHGAIVGANSVVVTDLPDWVTAVGVPARIIKWGQTQV